MAAPNVDIANTSSSDAQAGDFFGGRFEVDFSGGDQTNLILILGVVAALSVIVFLKKG